MVYDSNNLWYHIIHILSEHIRLYSIDIPLLCFYSSWDDFLRIFGGNDNNYARSNTLWRYSLQTSLWTWMGGSTGSGITTSHSYGVQGVASSTNWPPARERFTMVIDSKGETIWLFGTTNIFAHYSL
jgi:hypothetical protein